MGWPVQVFICGSILKCRSAIGGLGSLDCEGQRVFKCSSSINFLMNCLLLLEVYQATHTPDCLRKGCFWHSFQQYWASSLYLGQYSGVADVELAGIYLACESRSRDSDSGQPGVIQRAQNLATCQPESWIEEDLKRLMDKKPRTIMWVKGHNGNSGNEKAGRIAKETEVVGRRMHKPDIATPAGIRQSY